MAGISAAQIIHNQAIDPYVTIRVAVALEGHPDNVAPAILGGVVMAALGAWLSARISTALLRTLFGVFLLFVGISELRTRAD